MYSESLFRLYVSLVVDVLSAETLCFASSPDRVAKIGQSGFWMDEPVILQSHSIFLCSPELCPDACLKSSQSAVPFLGISEIADLKFWKTLVPTMK